jgi:hypothetical protein
MIYVLALLGAAALVGTVYVVLEQQRILDEQARTIARQRALIANMQDYQQDAVARLVQQAEIIERQHNHAVRLGRTAPLTCTNVFAPSHEWLN